MTIALTFERTDEAAGTGSGNATSDGGNARSIYICLHMTADACVNK